MSYQSEYKRFPAITASGGSGGGGGGGGGAPAPEEEIPTDGSNPLVATLVGQEQTYNRRGIQFYSAKPAKRQGMQGLWQVGQGQFELLDPFLAKDGSSSHPYYVMFDSNYDNSLTVPARSGSGTEQIFVGVAVWSLGADGVLGANGKTSDDVYAY
jgi:hypothetical protein